MKEFEAKGWKAESDGTYGFVFMNRDGERVLLEVMPRDPTDTSASWRRISRK